MKGSPEAEAAAERFIERIEKGILKKRIVQNSSEEYPVEKAAESFKHFVNSEQIEPFMSEDTE